MEKPPWRTTAAYTMCRIFCFITVFLIKEKWAQHAPIPIKNERNAPIKSLVLFTDRMVTNCPIDLLLIIAEKRNLSIVGFKFQFIVDLPLWGRWRAAPDEVRRRRLFQ